MIWDTRYFTFFKHVFPNRFCYEKYPVGYPFFKREMRHTLVWALLYSACGRCPILSKTAMTRQFLDIFTSIKDHENIIINSQTV